MKQKKVTMVKEMSAQWVELSIRSLIFQEALKGKLHCDWYSSRLFTPAESDISNISEILNKLETEEKYHCRMKVLEPTEEFESRVIRVHISWEEI